MPHSNNEGARRRDDQREQQEHQDARQFEADDPRHPCNAALKMAEKALELAQDLNTLVTGQLSRNEDGKKPESGEIEKAIKSSLLSRVAKAEFYLKILGVFAVAGLGLAAQKLAALIFGASK